MDYIYYHPEPYGLEVFGQVDFRVADYEFDFACIWRTENNVFYAATDAGCSCPIPFERITSVDDLDGPMDRAAIIEWITELRIPEYSSDPNPEFQAQKVRLIERILDL
jgi:hypothetical protein